MADFSNRNDKDGLWRGERITMIGFDTEEAEPDLVVFSIEVKPPGASDFEPLRNRMAFSYLDGAGQRVHGNRIEQSAVTYDGRRRNAFRDDLLRFFDRELRCVGH
jgi:hypothetical protein